MATEKIRGIMLKPDREEVFLYWEGKQERTFGFSQVRASNSHTEHTITNGARVAVESESNPDRPFIKRVQAAYRGVTS